MVHSRHSLTFGGGGGRFLGLRLAGHTDVHYFQFNGFWLRVLHFKSFSSKCCAPVHWKCRNVPTGAGCILNFKNCKAKRPLSLTFTKIWFFHRKLNRIDNRIYFSKLIIGTMLYLDLSFPMISVIVPCEKHILRYIHLKIMSAIRADNHLFFTKIISPVQKSSAWG